MIKKGLFYWILIPLTLLGKVSLGQPRIVSANGTLSEIIVGLGLESALVGVDITSTYPASLNKLPKIGHNRTISIEGVLALNPDIFVYTDQSAVRPLIVTQLKQAGKKVIAFKQEYSLEGTIQLIQEVGNYFKKPQKAVLMIKTLKADLAKIQPTTIKKKLLFVYARGTGTLLVAGKGTSPDKLFEISGNQNAVTSFSDFKPLTAESLVLANPDVLVLFSSGLESLDGNLGLLKVPGVAATNAGKNKQIISMDGQLMTGFGPRLGKAALELAQKVKTSQN